MGRRRRSRFIVGIGMLLGLSPFFAPAYSAEAVKEEIRFEPGIDLGLNFYSETDAESFSQFTAFLRGNLRYQGPPAMPFQAYLGASWSLGEIFGGSDQTVRYFGGEAGGWYPFSLKFIKEWAPSVGGGLRFARMRVPDASFGYSSVTGPFLSLSAERELARQRTLLFQIEYGRIFGGSGSLAGWSGAIGGGYKMPTLPQFPAVMFLGKLGLMSLSVDEFAVDVSEVTFSAGFRIEFK